MAAGLVANDGVLFRPFMAVCIANLPRPTDFLQALAGTASQPAPRGHEHSKGCQWPPATRCRGKPSVAVVWGISARVGGRPYLGWSNRECTQFQSDRFPVFEGMDLEQRATIRFLELMPRQLPARWAAISDCWWSTDCKSIYVLGCLDRMMPSRVAMDRHTGY